MKREGLIFKVFTALLALCYILSTFGFNIHRDLGCGHSYLTMLVVGTDCNDVHPFHHCHSESNHSHCCSSHTSSCCEVSAHHHGQESDTEEVSGECRHCINESFSTDDTANIKHGISIPSSPAIHCNQLCHFHLTKASLKQTNMQERQLPPPLDILSQCCISRT